MLQATLALAAFTLYAVTFNIIALLLARGIDYTAAALRRKPPPRSSRAGRRDPSGQGRPSSKDRDSSDSRVSPRPRAAVTRWSFFSIRCRLYTSSTHGHIPKD
ncbi:hypothetical protein [Arthrobacter sp. ISL-30]|uniref:hypothetical protein n=1 Tax=Arthrobacter sp. ISL-30 TaxID=2819109 RepID=UPI0020350842|nr:hypothetical protein [Arthrobacter sp. ISL-30]